MDPEEIAIRNLLAIQRIGNTLSGEARRRFRGIFADLVGLLARINPGGAASEASKLRRVRRFLDEADAVLGPEFDAWLREMSDDLTRIGLSQADTAADMMDSMLGGRVDISRGAITARYFRQVLDSRPFAGEVLADWVERQESATMRRLRQQLQLGVLNNETTGEIMERVIGREIEPERLASASRRRRLGESAGGILSRTERDAETIVRTGVNGIANTAHFAFYGAQRDVTLRYEYVATLDSRTSDICMSLDGQTWEYEDPNGRQPPQHPNCRSTIVPVVDWDGLGLEPPKRGTRASQFGQTNAQNYEEWLRAQSPARVRSILGEGRGDLFIEGRISLRDLVRSDNSTVPLEELRG